MLCSISISKLIDEACVQAYPLNKFKAGREVFKFTVWDLYRLPRPGQTGKRARQPHILSTDLCRAA
eukprot:361935-Chlamydomonas_euryale.AAC.17